MGFPVERRYFRGTLDLDAPLAEVAVAQAELEPDLRGLQSVPVPPDRVIPHQARVGLPADSDRVTTGESVTPVALT